MSHPIYLSFQLKTSKADTQGKFQIYVRININGLRIELSLKRNVDESRWQSNAGVVKGSNEESKSLNSFLTTVRLKLNEQYRTLLEANLPITPAAIKNAYLGVKEKERAILVVFHNHNNQVHALIGKDYSKGTYDRYCTALKHTQEFIQWKYKISDLAIRCKSSA